jgi:integral membrane sensor domain MASE1
MADIFVPLTFFVFLGAVIIVPILAKERTKRSAHDLISRAMERGQALEPALVAQLTQNMLEEGNRARKSLGNGVILLALALGFVAMGFVANGLDHGDGIHNGMLVPAVFLATIGAAFLLLAGIDYATKKRAVGEAPSA